MRLLRSWPVAVAIIAVLLNVSAVRADSTSGTAAPSHWQVYAWIGQNVQSGIMTMTTSGEKVVAHFNNITFHGTLVDNGNQINATYTGPRGDGWVTLHFHNEGNGFGGEWGLKGKPADGKFVGTRATASPAPAASQ